MGGPDGREMVLILIGGSRHSRLVKTKSEKKLEEALEMLRTNEIIENSTG